MRETLSEQPLPRQRTGWRLCVSVVPLELADCVLPLDREPLVVATLGACFALEAEKFSGRVRFPSLVLEAPLEHGPAMNTLEV